MKKKKKTVKRKEHKEKHKKSESNKAVTAPKRIPKDSLISNKLFIFLVIAGLILLAFKLNSLGDGEHESPFGGFTILNQMVLDEVLDDEEVQKLSSLDCEELKELLGDGKEGCIYFEDMQGHLVDLDNDGVIGFGCSEYLVEGQKICKQK